jgi:hypothetical protein
MKLEILQNFRKAPKKRKRGKKKNTQKATYLRMVTSTSKTYDPKEVGTMRGSPTVPFTFSFPSAQLPIMNRLS